MKKSVLYQIVEVYHGLNLLTQRMALGLTLVLIILLQLFCLFLMITSSLLYASIFGHVTTIIHNMTLAAAKYHDMLNNVREFMVLNEVTTWMSKSCSLLNHQVPRNLTERVTDYIVSKWTNTKGVEQDKVDKLY